MMFYYMCEGVGWNTKDSGEIGKLETLRSYLVDWRDRGRPRGTLPVKSTFIILHLIFFHFSHINSKR